MDTLWPGRSNQPRDPLDFPAKLPSPLSRPRANSPVRSSSDKGKQKAHGPQRKIAHTADVPLGQATYVCFFYNSGGFADVVGVDDGERPYVLFFCLRWFQKKKKKEVPQPVYDDELEDDEEEENLPFVIAAIIPAASCSVFNCGLAGLQLLFWRCTQGNQPNLPDMYDVVMQFNIYVRPSLVALSS
ncbi:hypothetical protein EDD22DRAFT_842660 [Suillus occidentalis]|nr:hypothetical protein EDD22DRAFT_842660 [Suillus occidentalis]